MQRRLFLVFLILVIFSSFCQAKTAFYGQVLIKDRPYVGLGVSASWIDKDGKLHISQTRTLTADEAQARGSLELAGYYYFTQEYVNPKANTNIIVSYSGLPYYLIVSSNSLPYKIPTVSFRYAGSGGSSEGNISEINSYYSPPSVNELEDLALKNEQNNPDAFDRYGNDMNKLGSIESFGYSNATYDVPIKNKPAEPAKSSSTAVKDAFSIISFILALFGLVGFMYLFTKYGVGYVSGRIYIMMTSQGTLKAKKILDKKARSIMEEATTFESSTKVSMIMQYFTTSRGSVVYITKHGEFIGCVHAKKLLNYDDDIEKTIGEAPLLIDKDKYVVQSEISIDDVYYLMKDASSGEMGVISKDKLVGEISLFDIQRLISSYSGEFQKKNFPTVREIVGKTEMLVKKTDLIDDVRSSMMKRNASYAMISDEERIIGIFTYTDYLRGLIKVGKGVLKRSVNSMMGSPLQSIDPDMDILQANDFMVSKEYKNYPVIVNGTLLGVMTQMRLCEELIYMIKDMKSSR